ncbi:Alpha/Beta hydrolase protein [Hypoxylon crocopeplum]|nr:Alpha/Beta hydrolase protein [Hypoxylon crocopeplum]
MGQGPSHDEVHLETRVENPKNGKDPQGLALIAHGRLGGTFDQPPVRLLAEYLRDERQLRVVTWNARGMGGSGGGNEWTHLGVWLGDAGISDYHRMLRESMTAYVEDFPEAKEAPLFICGYSAGAIFAGCSRPPISFPQFAPAHYVLISYPVDLNPLIGIHKSGSYFRSVEALVQGHGWENLPAEFHGKEPEVTGVFTVTGQLETFVFYGMWTGILGSKNARNILKQVVVEGAGHAWGDKAPRIVEEVNKWLSTL